MCITAQDTITHKVFHLGHSLVSPTIPAMLQSFGDSTSTVDHTYNYGIINGAPLFWQWDHADDCQGYQASTVNSKQELASGEYDVFVMTEGVPWYSIMNDFYKYADSFHIQALSGNADIQTYLYETFNCINTGTPVGCMYDDQDTVEWTARIRQDTIDWGNVADSLNVLHPDSKPVLVIPAGQALANLKDSIDAGSVPGLTDIYAQLFSDDIHPNDTGKYFIALVHFACIYKQSPIGLPEQTFSEWGVAFDPPPADMALKFQEIVWETVLASPRSGVSLILPVENVSSNLYQKEQKVYLEWTTEYEINNDRFELERSYNLKNFRKIATIEAAGNSSTHKDYQYVDHVENVIHDHVYYRLKQIDTDGKFSYLFQKSIRLDKRQQFTVVPNPFSEEIVIKGLKNNSTNVLEIYNSYGELYLRQNLYTNRLNLHELDKGIYFLKIKNTLNGESSFQKVIKL